VTGRREIALTGVDLGIAALAAVLRNMGGPAWRDEVERAVVLSVLPGPLSRFDNGPSIATLSIPWAEVLRRAIVEHLLAVDEDGRWRAGSDIDDAPSDILDARALAALSWLRSVRDQGEDS
jgi:hypothetical protein